MNAAYLEQLVAANPTADAAAILVLAQGDPRTVSPILGPALRVMFTDTGIAPRLRRSADVIAQQSRSAADQLSGFVDYAMAGGDFDSTNPAYAGKAAALAAMLIPLHGQDASLGLSAEEYAAVIALGGGYRVYDATQADVEAAMAKLPRLTATKALRTLIAADFLAAQNAFNAAKEAFNTARDLQASRVAKADALWESNADVPADLLHLDGGD